MGIMMFTQNICNSEGRFLPSQFREIFHQDLDVIVEYSIYERHELRTQAVLQGQNEV